MATMTVSETNDLKARLKETWSAGDYDRFSRYMEQVARLFYEQLDIPPGSQLLDVACGSGQLLFDYPFSPAETVELFRQYYGPTSRAFDSLDERSSDRLRDELERLWSIHNRAGNDLTFVPAEYLEVIAVRA